ncbi:hypothetical protein [Enterococcus sp. 2201sp1_2201st1_B8_2201SCRN_220225]|uniref:hypothetical protein n=1 Tax=unclassified Enterococcus TaxID=2608891 RepID=UPI0034A3ADEB
MIVTFNQIAYFKPETTARRLKKYYYSETCRPAVFLSYLRLINVVALLCPNVKKVSVALYRKEVRELFFTHRDDPKVVKYLWRFRRFFSDAECCCLLKKSVLEIDSVVKKEYATASVLQPSKKRSKRSVFAVILQKITGTFLPSTLEYSENSVKTVDIGEEFRYFCTNEKPTTDKQVMKMKDNAAIFGLLLL